MRRILFWIVDQLLTLAWAWDQKSHSMIVHHFFQAIRRALGRPFYALCPKYGGDMLGVLVMLALDLFFALPLHRYSWWDRWYNAYQDEGSAYKWQLQHCPICWCGESMVVDEYDHPFSHFFGDEPLVLDEVETVEVSNEA